MTFPRKPITRFVRNFVKLIPHKLCEGKGFTHVKSSRGKLFKKFCFDCNGSGKVELFETLAIKDYTSVKPLNF